MSEPGSLIRSLSGRPAARNYHSFVINEIGLAIAAGDMAVGSILPNDAEMMARFGVSRTVLREALKTLEAKGLVEARAKVGTRVIPQSRWNLYDRQVLTWIWEAGPDAAFLASITHIRHLLEVEAAGLAALHRTPEHMRVLAYWFNQRAQMTQQPEPFALAEFELHRVICEASGNAMLRAASGVVEFGVAASIAARLGPDLTAPAAGLAEPLTETYAALLRKIVDSDVSAARALMATILQTA